MELKELRCKSCGAPLAPENVVERLSMARCGHCEAVFALERMEPGTDSRPARRERPQVPLPKGMEVVDLGSSFEIRRRWFSPVFIFLLFFCLFWNGFMVVWHSIALSEGMWFLSCFGLLHTAVGIALAYFTVAGFVNTTVVRVAQGLIEVQHGPLPWPGNKCLEAHEVEQFYCREQAGKSDSTQRTYEVMMLRKGNVRDTLVKGLTDPDQALYIEQELERYLRIADQPIAGELPR